MKDYVLGLDFGTSKTVLTWNRSGGPNPQVEDVLLSANTEGRMGAGARIPTYLAVDRSDGSVVIGDQAQFQHMRTLGRNTNYDFHANFKPQIYTDPDARHQAELFLQEVFKLPSVAQNVSLWGNDAILVAGCPASWTDEEQESLAEILRSVGSPKPLVVPEPVGATFYFLAKGLRAKDFVNDVVVVDWGAGTFDMSVVRSGIIKDNASCGSPIYGGRLFDDLVAQWFFELIEEGDDPALKDRLKRARGLRGFDIFILNFKARLMKEELSYHLSNNIGKATIEPFEMMEDITFGARREKVNLGEFYIDEKDLHAAFEARARRYRASETLSAWIAKSTSDISPEERTYYDKLTRGEEIDLIEWGRFLFERGMSELQIGASPFFILTGGSSNWYWLRQMVETHPLYNGSGKRIFVDQQPELTIGRGLGRAYSIGGHCENLKKTIESRNSELSKELTAATLNASAAFADDIVHLVLNDPRAGKLLDGIRNLFERRFAESLVAEEVKARIPKLIEDWFAGEEIRAVVLEKAGDYAHAVSGETMKILQVHYSGQIEGLIEVTVEANTIAGEGDIVNYLIDFVENVKVDWGFFDEVFRSLSDWWAKNIEGTEKSEATKREERTNQMFQKFCNSFAQTMKKNITNSNLTVSANVMRTIVKSLNAIVQSSAFKPEA